MTAKRLTPCPVERIWGRETLPAPFDALGRGSEPIGEIWFRDDETRPGELLVKYLFTTERLSIQVHPDDRFAQALGHRCGKDEAWLVLEAEPGAVIGLGLTREMESAELRALAENGAIETAIDWRPVAPGEVYYSPAGTIHAIGAGLSLVEIQQDLDLTFRLYDYGRPRELHLDQGIAAADPKPWRPFGGARDFGGGRRALASGGAFVVERWKDQTGRIVAPRDGPVTLVPLGGAGELDGMALDKGSVWLVEDEAWLESHRGTELLVAYSGREAREDLLAPWPVRAGS